MIESVDRRVLGGFVCVDAITGTTVIPPIRATSDQWRLRANRSGVYAIMDGPGLSNLTTQFLPHGAWPAAVAHDVLLIDPNRRYLTRRAKVTAPAHVPTIPPDPVKPAGVFVPQAVAVYPSPSSPVGSNWTTIHASVVRQGTNPPVGLASAVLLVTRNSDHAVLATGQTDANGEALLAVLGLKVQANTHGHGPVTVSSVAATITAYFDPSALHQAAGWVPDPDDILHNVANPALKSANHAAQLSAGQELALSFSIAV